MIAAAKPRRAVRRPATTRRAPAAVNGHAAFRDEDAAALASFDAAMKDIDEGRVVDMETALYEAPPRA